ncbi:OmpA family protein [Vibrio methylphosphonaticus]|uniref:OmpA family protein n=1 Tax=Vibrio methylphosphonaticus TaxID=2946866 RepID=UPI002029DB75|nr:OmpA family protein [Vibrio methylphosphonaticus]MCL9775220.1 OmpA family protein [Vibrio methylphosphonaticus]
MKIKKVVVVAGLMTLVGCQATQRQNATTGQYETNSATKGAVIGAIAGTAVGIASGGDSRGILLGAASGAAIGGGAGYYFDQQEKALRQELLNSGVQVERTGDNQLILRLENGIGFNSDSYALNNSINNTLKGVARVLVEYPDTSLVIDGFTDSSGNAQYNQELSEKRAEQVRSFLVSQDVAAGRAVARGNGERFPICSNVTSEGRKCNRRVEIKIMPLS